MDDFNNINANILLGAAISAGATERQTKEMSKKLQEASEASSVAYMELAAAIREQNYLSSLNEDERKEYFRQKQEIEEKRRQEVEEENRRKQEILEAKKKEEEEAEERKNVIMSLVFIGAIVLFGLFVLLYCVNIK